MITSKGCITSVKKVTEFPVPSRDVTNQTLQACGEYLNYSRPVRVWLVISRLGTGNSLTFFYSVSVGVELETTVCQYRLKPLEKTENFYNIAEKG
jgi:hypothetical protein